MCGMYFSLGYTSLPTMLQILSEIVIYLTNRPSFVFINTFCKIYAENYLPLSPGTVSIQ